MNITMIREEVRDVLGVSEGGLKTIIKRGQLKDRLLSCGLELINEYKDGRSSVYELSPIELDYWDRIQLHYNVKKKSEHTIYTHARLDGGMKKSRASIIRDSDINISGNTAKKFDDILENEGVIMKNEEVYMLYHKENNVFEEITKQEYLTFWKEVKYCNELMVDNRRKLLKYEISQDTYDLRTTIILDAVGKECGSIAIKFDTYKELQDTQELIELLSKKIGGQ